MNFEKVRSESYQTTKRNLHFQPQNMLLSSAIGPEKNINK